VDARVSGADSTGGYHQFGDVLCKTLQAILREKKVKVRTLAKVVVGILSPLD